MFCPSVGALVWVKSDFKVTVAYFFISHLPTLVPSLIIVFPILLFCLFSDVVLKRNKLPCYWKWPSQWHSVAEGSVGWRSRLNDEWHPECAFHFICSVLQFTDGSPFILLAPDSYYWGSKSMDPISGLAPAGRAYGLLCWQEESVCAGSTNHCPCLGS